MYLKANPERDRSEEDKAEIAEKYTRGERVLPEAEGPKSPEELRAEEEDRRLVEEVRALSLREAGVEGSRRERESSRRDERARRQPPDSLRSGDERRRRRSESRRRVEERTRQIEHQSSIRSLIGSANMSERDIEKEIEEFARQIQEEGILDGLDLDNIDLTRDDDLSQKITDAYRRRLRERARQEAVPRDVTETSRSELSLPDARHARDSRSTSRRRYSAGASVRPDSRSRSQSVATRTSGSARLEVQRDDRMRRRRAASSGRSSTTPAHHSPAAATPLAARSQTDLTLQTRPLDPSNPRSVLGESRTISSPTVAVSSASAAENSSLSFASRLQPQSGTPSHESSPNLAQRSHRPADLSVPTPPAQSPLPSPSYKPPPPPPPPPLLFAEPSISCSRCFRPHIEYDVHYTCAPCSERGLFALCLSCYRAGRGCNHWFGFGHDAIARWDRARADNPSLDPPHKLWAGRYVRPQTPTVKDDAGRERTGEDPLARLQSGAFCDGCFEWASECFWRCSACNRGEWGFCDSCVNRGKACHHPLLPLSYQPLTAPEGSPGRVPSLPRRAALAGGGGGGTFRALTFSTRCDVCREAIPPAQARHHCFECASSLEEEKRAGDYDVCGACYSGMGARGEISPENGVGGWRRCPAGHRMVMVVFREGSDGQYRCVSRGLVGGHRLWEVPVDGDASVKRWCWREGGKTIGRLVSVDVAATAPGTGEGVEAEGVVGTERFPADGGGGMAVRARWGWLPPADNPEPDELYFPRGAEIKEVEDLNGDWFVGWYAGREGVFPAAYVVQV